jgi:hypothetical protein
VIRSLHPFLLYQTVEALGNRKVETLLSGLLDNTWLQRAVKMLTLGRIDWRKESQVARISRLLSQKI